MGFTSIQVDQMLKPIAKQRVLRDARGHAHVSQQDILAHLIRCFGFGNFDTDVLNVELIFEEARTKDGELGPVMTGKWDVCYRALVRLTVRDPHGLEICHYENGSTATAQNQARGDAHDLSMKAAISLSVKRAATALGDQFGLSLYSKGQMSALVLGTLVRPDGSVEELKDMQEGVPRQEVLGNDEEGRPLIGEVEPEDAT